MTGSTPKRLIVNVLRVSLRGILWIWVVVFFFFFLAAVASACCCGGAAVTVTLELHMNKLVTFRRRLCGSARRASG